MHTRAICQRNESCEIPLYFSWWRDKFKPRYFIRGCKISEWRKAYKRGISWLFNLDKITGEHAGKRLLQFYQENGVDVGSCRGQCYDGVSNMPSLRKGVASYILKESLNVIVTHCSSHNLNLSIATTSKIPIIDNILEVYKCITIFFNTSPKRERLLENVAELRCVSAEKRKILVGMCKIRWSERDVAYEHFYLAIPF